MALAWLDPMSAALHADAAPDRLKGHALTHSLGPGHVTDRSAVVWGRGEPNTGVALHIEGPDGGRARLDLETSGPEHDGTFAVRLEELRADRAYRVRADFSDGASRTAALRTAPPADATPEAPFSIAFCSCNQPFDEAGHIRDDARRMYEMIGQATERFGVRHLLMLGDQIYADQPEPLSLFEERYFAAVEPLEHLDILDCSREQVRRVYHERHRIFFGVPELQALLSSVPTTMVLDDHDIVDNFGSDPAHATERWSALRDGALDAIFDYQNRRAWPDLGARAAPADHSVRIGPLAAHVIDLRSRRRMGDDSQIMAASQLDELDRFLDAHADVPVLLIGLTVPPVHVPEWMAQVVERPLPNGTDIADRWSHPAFVAQRDAILERLWAHRLAHPSQRLAILGGDIHAGVATRLCAKDLEIPQLISSPVTNPEQVVFQMGAAVAARLGPALSVGPMDGDRPTRMDGVEGRDENPVTDSNVGVVSVEPGEGGLRAVFRTLTCGADGAPEVVFETEL